MVMNGCEAESKTSSGPRGLSRTQRGTQIQPLHLEHENESTRHDELRPLPSTLEKTTDRCASALLFILLGHFPWEMQWEVFWKKKKKNQSKNQYTHVCFSFINFIVCTVSEGLSWEFPCPLTYMTDVWIKKCVLRLQRIVRFTEPSLYLQYMTPWCIQSFFFLFLLGKYSTGYSIMVCVVWMI